MKTKVVDSVKMAICISLVHACLVAALYAEECTVKVIAVTARPVFSVDEPIEIRVTYRNEGASDVGVMTAYPNLIRFDAAAAGVASTRTEGSAILSASFALRSLKVAEDTVSVIYAQRFMSGFTVGHYEVPWLAAVPCMPLDKVAPRESVSGSALGRGVFSFDVVAGERSALLATYERHLADATSTNVGRSIEGSEALMVSPSLEVIPFLERMWKSGHTREAMNALSKFRNEARVRSFVKSAVSSERPGEVGDALMMLTDWNVSFSKEEIAGLLENGKEPVRRMLLQFVGKTGDLSHVPIIEQYIASSDNTVAEAAISARLRIQQKQAAMPDRDDGGGVRDRTPQ